MAARLTKRVTENHRKSIQVSMLINRLTDHAFADEPIMNSSQVDSAKYLISQGIGTPSAAVELTGEGGGPIGISVSFKD